MLSVFLNVILVFIRCPQRYSAIIGNLGNIFNAICLFIPRPTPSGPNPKSSNPSNDTGSSPNLTSLSRPQPQIPASASQLDTGRLGASGPYAAPGAPDSQGSYGASSRGHAFCAPRSCGCSAVGSHGQWGRTLVWKHANGWWCNACRRIGNGL